MDRQELIIHDLEMATRAIVDVATAVIFVGTLILTVANAVTFVGTGDILPLAVSLGLGWSWATGKLRF